MRRRAPSWRGFSAKCAAKAPGRGWQRPAHADAGRVERTWPLCFTHRNVTVGNGFVAGVKITGMLVAHQEDDGIWLEGATPSGIVIDTEITELGNLKPSVRTALENAVKNLAEEARDFAEFKAMVLQFAQTTDPETELLWNTALERVRLNADDRLDDIDTWPAEDQQPAASVENLDVGDLKPTTPSRQTLVMAA